MEPELSIRSKDRDVSIDGERRRGANPLFAATLRDRISEEIRDRILSGELRSGTRLDLEELAEEFGSSRTPLREALIQLSHDGLVEIMPRRGARVRGMTRDEVRDNFDVFGALSGIATEWATRRATPDLIERLRELDQAVTEAAGSTSTELIESNWLLHREIHRACGSRRLRALIRQLDRTIPFGFLRVVPEQIEISIPEHHAMLEAMETGDAERARKIAEDHVRSAGDRLVQHLDAQDHWADESA